MAESQTWRVVLAPRTLDGAAEERQLTVAWVERFGGAWTCDGHGYHRFPRRAAMMAAFALDYHVAEILAPGEPTSAELAAALATVTAERNALRTKLAYELGRRPVDEAGARAMRAAALATARREGAAEMLARCRTAARAAFDAHPLTLNRYHSPGCICDAIGRGSCSKCDRGDAVVDALDALPLDGDGGAPDCTGITAQWCPRCGDCTCPLLHEGNVEGGRTLNDPKCPLHAPSSPHGDGGGR